MTRPLASPLLLRPTQALPPVSGMLLVLTLAVLRWETLRRTRKDLSRLDAHMLKDIGMDQLQAQNEAIKPFWRD